MEKVLAVIPARGGSEELRRKNLLPDANGVPLVLASARAARDTGCEVWISTDDPEVASLAAIDGHWVQHRGPELATVPVDEVVSKTVGQLAHEGPVLLVQPTVQPMTADLLKWFLNEAPKQTLDAATFIPVALGVEDRHLIWHDGKLLTDRADRQTALPWPIREMGVRWWPAGASPSRDRPLAVIAAPHYLVDIDTAQDYQAITKRLTIQFLVTGSKQTGSGHLRRVMTLAEGLQHHTVAIALDSESGGDAYDTLHERGWPAFYDTPDVFVYDALGRRWPDEAHYGGLPTVGLEVTDSGYTATVNAMYGDGDYTGAKYAVLRPEFTIGTFHVKQDADKVLVLFGGTDPANLTGLAEFAAQQWDVDIIHPGDDRSVASAMHDADLLITSGGRTVFEAAATGIPTIVLCQNMRETTHTHLGVGNVNMGLGRLVDPDRLTYVIQQTLEDYELRRDMSAVGRQSIDSHGADRVRRIIEHVGLYGEAP